MNTFQLDASGNTVTTTNDNGGGGAAAASTTKSFAIKCMLWGGSNTFTANTGYAFNQPLNTANVGYSVLPLTEAMPNAGTVNYVALYCPGQVAGGTLAVKFMKNGAAAANGSTTLTCSTAATVTTAVVSPATPVTFSANDILSLQGFFSTGGNQCVYATLYYTLNS